MYEKRIQKLFTNHPENARFRMASDGPLHPMGHVHWGYSAGMGRRTVVWFIGLGSKARGSPSLDGIHGMAGGLQVCAARVLDFVDRSCEKIISVC